MVANTSAGAAVRKAFRQGRPPKMTTDPLHPEVVWARAVEALCDFRSRLADAGIDPLRTWAEIVYILPVPPNQPQRPYFIRIEREGATAEDVRNAALKALSQPGAFALGMMFEQHDDEGGADGGASLTTFPFQFTGLTEQRVGILKFACTMQEKARKMLDLKTQN